MRDLTILPLGIGDAFSKLHYSSCLAVEYDGAWLVIDCPHPIRKMMWEASQAAGVSLDIPDVLGVALTHLHADHSSGLEGFGYYSYFATGEKARLLAHPDVTARLWDAHLAAGMEQLIVDDSLIPQPQAFDSYFALTPLSETEEVTIGPFAIACRKTIHHVPTTAFRIRAGGRCFGYSADTAFDPDLIAWLSEADLIVHETNYGIHTPYESLAALPAALRAKMRLIHFPDEFDAADSVIACLAQGVRYGV